MRKYADFAVVRTARQQAVSDDGVKLGEPKMSGAGAFQALAGYIFGEEQARGEDGDDDAGFYTRRPAPV